MIQILSYKHVHIFLSFTHPIFLTRPVRGNLVQDVSTIVPLPLMLQSCVGDRVVSPPFCLRGLPPSCTSPSEDAFQGVDHRIVSFIADPSHCSPHTFGNHLMQKGPTHYSRPKFLRFCFLKRKRRTIVFVSHLLILSKVCLVHDQFSLREDCIYVVHQSSTLDLPQDVLTFVC